MRISRFFRKSRLYQPKNKEKILHIFCNLKSKIKFVLLQHIVRKKRCYEYQIFIFYFLVNINNIYLQNSQTKHFHLVLPRLDSLTNHTRLFQANTSRSVTQYHYTSWPDHGTPEPLDLVLFHNHVMTSRASSDTSPLVVHCR